MMYYITRMDIIPELNDKQLDRLSEFLANFTLLMIASLVLPNIFGTEINSRQFISGITLTILSFLFSMIIIRK